MKTTRRQYLGLTMAGLSMPYWAAHAQTTPSIARIVTGFAAGGSSDAVARLLADQLKGTHADTVLVDNRPGAGQRIAINQMKSADTDASQILLATGASMVIYPHIYKKLDYDPLKDFVPVALLVRLPLALCVGPAVPTNITTLLQFLDWCRANPKGAAYGSTGAGSRSHFIGVMLQRASTVQFVHVAYRGGAPAVSDLIGGQVPLAIVSVADALAHSKGGRLRILATSGSVRAQQLPDVPTIKEAGVPGIEVVETFGLYLPAATPAATVNRLSGMVNAVLAKPDVSDRLVQMGVEVAGTDPEQSLQLLRAEYTQWGALVKSENITIDE